jgi:signal transduction histidine kinase
MPHIRGNHNQLTQVFINLINNAVQAMSSGGGNLVKVALRHRIGGAMKPAVEIMVSDNGPGISAEIRDHLFEPFTTTKDTGDRGRKGGMGLGLAIVKRIVDGHNGVIRVDSETGMGTTFTIILPCEVPP